MAECCHMALGILGSSYSHGYWKSCSVTASPAISWGLQRRASAELLGDSGVTPVTLVKGPPEDHGQRVGLPVSQLAHFSSFVSLPPWAAVAILRSLLHFLWLSLFPGFSGPDPKPLPGNEIFVMESAISTVSPSSSFTLCSSPGPAPLGSTPRHILLFLP